jgi:hypothetical protein
MNMTWYYQVVLAASYMAQQPEVLSVVRVGPRGMHHHHRTFCEASPTVKSYGNLQLLGLGSWQLQTQYGPNVFPKIVRSVLVFSKVIGPKLKYRRLVAIILF